MSKVVEINMTEQEAYDAWCPEPYRRTIWTEQSQAAARAAFAAAWYLLHGGQLKSAEEPGPLSKGEDFKSWWERGLSRS